jgi:hypothetical protein
METPFNYRSSYNYIICSVVEVSHDRFQRFTLTFVGRLQAASSMACQSPATDIHRTVQWSATYQPFGYTATGTQ